MDNSDGFVPGLLVGCCIAFFTFMITLGIMSHSHQKYVFDDMVQNHGCKLVESYRDGVPTKGSTCVMPDGKVISTSR
jgi:hypothetical protein